MSKLIWNTLKLSPILITATLVLASRTQAAQTNVVELAPQQTAAVSSKNNLIAELRQLDTKPLQVAQQPVESASSQVAQNTQAADALAPATSVSQLSEPAPNTMAQVTSVSQLSDVQPTDWAFQALQSLVERYGCIAGYPDGTYRGNRALTRYEFAAGLNACLDRVNELISTATADLVTKEDLATLQRLQEEFSAELATLRGRVDTLEARTAELEANQFSTTTKLTGEVIFAVADVFGDEAAVASGQAAGGRGDLEVNTILADRARLNFDTSFTGKDLLRTRLQARNITPFTRTAIPGAAGDTGTAMTRLGFDGNENNDVQLDDFFYRFPVTEFANVKIDFDNVEFNDNVYTFNPVFESSGRGAISRFGRFNPIYRQGSEGAGLTVNLNPEGAIGLSLGYLTPRANDPGEGLGLFNGDYAALAQLAFRPSDAISLGLTYAHSYDNTATSDVTGNNGIGVSGGTGSNFANNPFNGADTSSNHYSAQASFKLGERLTLSGWGGYTVAIAEEGPGALNRGATAEIWNWAATLALQDFGKEGSVLGLIFGQPPRAADTDFAGRRDRDTSYHLEALYRLPVTDNLEITPGVIVLFNPEHNDDNDNIYVGTIRTTFRF